MSEQSKKTIEMTREEYQQWEREVQLGIRDTMPDGTPVREISESLIEQQKEQDAARFETAPKSDETDAEKLETITFENGVVSATRIGEKQNDETVLSEDGDENKEPENDLPEGFPSRDKLLAAGFTSLETIAKLSLEELKSVDGIGARSADAILNYGKSAE